MNNVSDSAHSMRQVRVNHDKNFTTVSNEFIRDNKLSLKGKGLLLTILSLNDEEWDFSINGMCSILKESKTAVTGKILFYDQSNKCTNPRTSSSVSYCAIAVYL